MDDSAGHLGHKSSSQTSSSNSAHTSIVWAGKPLTKIYRDTVPSDDDIGRPLKLSCARNEFEGCMFGIRAISGVHDLKLDATDLMSGKGTIAKNNIKLRFVGCIPVPKNTSDTPLEELERTAPFDAPDPILDLERIDIKAGETQPCYFSVYVPEDTVPGDYRGHITVSSKESSESLPITLQVYSIVLPARRSVYVTNWFSVDKIASAHKVEMWSEGFWKAFEPWIAMMVSYGQNVFWIPLDTIKIFHKGRIYRFDFSLFDRYVELLMKYKAERVEIMHIARFNQWGGEEISLRNFEVTYPEGDVKTESGAEMLPYLLPALERHLEEKSWLDKSLIHVADEPTEDGIEAWKKVSEMIYKYAPLIRRIDAIETVGFEGYLEVWVPTLHHFNDWIDHYLKAMEDGYEIWFYTCLNPKAVYPNRFLDYSLLKARVLHWINYAYSLKGFLHWGFNWWREDPFGEPDPSLPPGDTHIAYPGQNGPIPSLRLEAMRDGLEDYEYLKLLEEELADIKTKLASQASSQPFERRALEICRKIVPSITGFIRDPAVLIETREAIVKEIMEAKRRPLALVLTEPPEWKAVVKRATTIIVRGVCEDGSNVEVNGKRVRLKEGYFRTYTHPSEQGEVITRIVKDGYEKVITRKFNVTC